MNNELNDDQGEIVETPPKGFERMVFECMRNARKASSKKDREYAFTPLWYWYYEMEKRLASNPPNAEVEPSPRHSIPPGGWYL